ncbi:hypothetical protein I4641_19970 [Waterburya agarophytonicola K14]|uniref:Uncharacterized protein n=1 Tax=Waterburya agarophytonicola KI4 TaxID=2874699 RepID=A0A964BU97_9CYAN|nr:hypothetical protein [Waterburya agarophytonicola]MCC0179244.1 hypothetical protein [Waterburya agarophytonicola KI4]
MTSNHASAKLQPESHTFRQFKAIFSHPHRFIESNNPYVNPKTGELRRTRGGKLKPDWRTETKYGIRPRVLLERFNDAVDLIGLSFSSTTKYFCGDIDITSSIHPAHNESGFKKWLNALEDIGLVRPVIIQSSFSGGLHVYFFFEEAIGTFNLACAVEGITKDYKIKIKSGELELFPNTKSYGKYYKGLKLPLQPMTGSYVVDSDYQPLTNDIDTFLNMAAMTAKSQDLVALKAACKKYGYTVRLERCSRGKGSIKRFEADLMKSIQRDFTGAGQTNDLLLDIGCYGVVFRRLDEEREIEALTDYIEETITNLDGYEEHCNHKHEIRRRCRDVAKSSQSQYWAVGKRRKRQGVFKDNFDKFLSGVENGNQAKAARAIQRLETTLAYIEKAGMAIPNTATEFIKLIIKTSQQLFELGIGKATLYKKANTPIWKTAFAELLAAQAATTTPAEAAIAPVVNQEIDEPVEQVEDVPETPAKNAETPVKSKEFRPLLKKTKTESLKPLQNKDSSDLVLYGGFGEGVASDSKNLKKASSLSVTPSPDLSLEPLELDSESHESQQQRSQNFKPILKPQKSDPTISTVNLSTASIARPRLKSEHQENLSIARQQREQTYLSQMEQLHHEINALEAQRLTPEYQSIAKAYFVAIRRILGIGENTPARGTPSPPT